MTLMRDANDTLTSYEYDDFNRVTFHPQLPDSEEYQNIYDEIDSLDRSK